MKKVLLTGMTAQHTSRRAHAKSASFSGLLADCMTRYGWTIDMIEPSMEWSEQDLDEYDAVVVGVAPLTSTSAHRAYGALSVVQKLQNDDRLVMLVDAPEPYKIAASLKAISKDPQKLVKPFYEKRSEYKKACEPAEQKRLLSVVEWLQNEQWPTTIYPALPWSTDDMLVRQLPMTLECLKHGLCPDAVLMSTTVKPDSPTSARHDWWCATAVQTDWVSEMRHHLRHPVVPAKATPKAYDDEVIARLAHATGTLATTYRQSTPWWTTRVAQSLAVHTPVVTDWRYSVGLGAPWAVLGATVESMDRLERHELALLQRSVYLQAIPSPDALQQQIATALGLREKVESTNG